jgi:hypothetical protein
MLKAYKRTSLQAWWFSEDSRCLGPCLTEAFGPTCTDLALSPQDLEHHLLVPFLPLTPQQVLPFLVVLTNPL